MRRKPVEVVVVGGGGFGTTLASLLVELGRSTRLWVRRQEQADEVNRSHTNERYLPGFRLPPGLAATADLADAVRGVPVVIVAIPSQRFREVVRSVGDTLSGDQVLVHATKGIEIETFKRMSEVLREETCALKIGVLSGPNLSKEIMAGHPAGAVVASRYDEVLRAAQGLFAGGRFRLYAGRDVVGVEVAGAFKNVIAIAAGAADGMGLGDNAKALVLTRGVAEMARLGKALGGDAATFAGLAGIGDMMATCFSPLSRNRGVGARLAAGERMDDILAGMKEVAEGVPTALAVHRQAKKLGIDMPITRAVHSVLYEGVGAREALERLSARGVGLEAETIGARPRAAG